jgi:hypothetical protein
MVRFAFDVKDGVHHMFQDLRTRDESFLGDVAHEERGAASSLRLLDEAPGTVPHLDSHCPAPIRDQRCRWSEWNRLRQHSVIFP